MSSSVIRGIINGNRERLEKLLKELPEFGGKAGSRDELERRQSQIQLTVTIIKKKIETMENKHKEWTQLIEQLKDQAKATEVAEYEKFMTEPRNFTERIEEAWESVAVMEVQLNEVENLLKRTPVTENTPSLTASTSSSFSLPKIDLSRFRGDPLTFQSFWDQFENLINQQTIPDSIKFTHLLSLLKGEAKSALEGIPVTNENYQEAVTILKNRFGNMQTVRRILYSRIQNLTKCSHDLESIKQFADTLEKTCRQLRNIDENPDQTALIFTVQEKLPYELVEELVKSRPVNDSWTMATLQNSLKQYIAVKEEVSDVLGDAKYRMKIERRYQSNGQINKKMNAIEQTFSDRNGPAMKKFTLCADPHIANECSTQAEVMPRRQCIDDLRLCFRCHKAGDQMRHCAYRKWRRYSCRENRHSDPFLSVDNFYYDEDRPAENQVYQKKREINPAFIDSPVIYQEQTKECFRKDQQILRNDMRRSKNLLVDRHIHNDTSYAQEQTSKLRPNTTLNQRTKEFVRPRQASAQVSHIDLKERQRNRNQIQAVSYVAIDEPNSSHEERGVYLMTAKVTVRNPETSDGKGEEIVVLFDSGSQRTFITAAMTSRLKLTPKLQQTLSLNILGAKASTEINSKSVKVEVELVDGAKKVIEASSIPTLTTKLKARLYKKDAGDSSHYETEVQPDILIGSDQMWEFLEGGRIRRLSDGFYQISTTLGNIVSGQDRSKILSSADKTFRDDQTNKPVRVQPSTNRGKADSLGYNEPSSSSSSNSRIAKKDTPKPPTKSYDEHIPNKSVNSRTNAAKQTNLPPKESPKRQDESSFNDQRPNAAAKKGKSQRLAVKLSYFFALMYVIFIFMGTSDNFDCTSEDGKHQKSMLFQTMSGEFDELLEDIGHLFNFTTNTFANEVEQFAVDSPLCTVFAMTGVFFVCLRSFRKFRSGTFSNEKINEQVGRANQEKDSNKRGEPPKTPFNNTGSTVRNSFENAKGTNQAGSRKDREQTASWQTKGKGQTTFESARNKIQNTAEKSIHNTMRNGKNEKMLPWERYVQVQFGSTVQQAAKISNDLSKPSNGHWERPKVQSRGTVQEPAKPPKNLFESNNGHREKSKVQHRGVVEETAENDMDDEQGPGLMTGLFD